MDNISIWCKVTDGAFVWRAGTSGYRLSTFASRPDLFRSRAKSSLGMNNDGESRYGFLTERKLPEKILQFG
jgi:hypothetical protein